MPIYEYLCKECSEKFEKLVLSSKQESTLSCPHCGGSATERVFSTFATSGSTDAGVGCAPGGRFR